MSIKDCQCVESLFKRMYALLITSFTNQTKISYSKDENVLRSDDTYSHCLAMINNLKLLLVFDN